MMRLLALLLLCLTAALPAHAADVPRPISQVPLLPLPPGEHAELEALLRAHWGPYYNVKGEQGFGRDKVRAGRFDVDGDGRAELFVLIAQESWEGQDGRPLVVANWTARGWNAIGWSWGDEDTVFVTTETINGWRTIDTGTQLMRWGQGIYDRVEKPAAH